MIKNILIFKSTKKEEGSKAPDYKMSAKVGEEYVDVGACWLKDSPKGGKYFSCKFSDHYVGEKGARKGYTLVEEPETAKEPTIDPDSGVDTNDIPF